ncbi:MAG TPA: ATP-binding protein [Tepidisphaeraceae bacterium]|nr:ATP-binding protein [Tepidisphaeraceae bacterium]
MLLIIGAALAVPWNRMEQLTSELNERSAGALADNAITEHIRLQRSEESDRDVTIMANSAADEKDALSGDNRASTPRLLPLTAGNARDLNGFEKKAIAYFKRRPDATRYFAYYNHPDGTAGYKYAGPLVLTNECSACHGSVGDTAATAPAHPQSALAVHYPLLVERPSKLAGIVSVDITSRIQEKQLLLNRVFILGAGLLAGTLAILSFYLITTRLILQPVRVLQETAEKVSRGDLNIRSDINTGDEFQQLSETLNTMLANLKQGADQLRAVNKGLDLKLSQLAESNLALYESNRLKSEFLANVSHELRTPLNSILGFADLLKDSAPDGADPRSTRYLNNILQSGKNLLDLINDLLDLAKIEAGKMEIRSEPISIVDLFEGLTNILKPLTEARPVSLAATVAPDVPIIRTDPGKLQQILYNFLANAIKFSPTGARIDLVAERERFAPSPDDSAADSDDRIRISVTDRGPGIQADKQHVIFEKFRQIDASHTRAHGGTGLGLAISRELTLLLSGFIGVRSAPGEGATFWISIPLKIQGGAMDLRGKLIMS